MRRFIHSSKVKIAASVAAVLLLGIVFAAVTHNSSSFLTSAISTVFSPLDKAAAALSRSLESFSISFRSSSDYLDQIEALQDELNKSTQKLAEYEKLKAKVEDLEKLLELKQRNSDFEMCYATVISRDAADAGSTFVLDVGSLDGVSVNDPVLCEENVVGIVKKVNSTTCVVLSVVDPRVSIGAYEVSTGEQGFVTGDTKLMGKQMFRLSGLKSTTTVVSGGIVCTSGSGGLFPSGLVLGTVETVENSEADTSVYATVKAAGNIAELSGVVVLTDFAGQGEKDDFSVDK